MFKMINFNKDKTINFIKNNLFLGFIVIKKKLNLGKNLIIKKIDTITEEKTKLVREDNSKEATIITMILSTDLKYLKIISLKNRKKSLKILIKNMFATIYKAKNNK